MSGADVLGWSAASLTLLTFFSGDMLRLRALALAANATFISYGLLAGLAPVLALHLVLVPVNLWRLVQLQRIMRQRAADATPSPPALPAAAVAAKAGSAVPGRLATGPNLAACASPLRRTTLADHGTTSRRARRASGSCTLSADARWRTRASAARPLRRRSEGHRR